MLWHLRRRKFAGPRAVFLLFSMVKIHLFLITAQKIVKFQKKFLFFPHPRGGVGLDKKVETCLEPSHSFNKMFLAILYQEYTDVFKQGDFDNSSLSIILCDLTYMDFRSQLFECYFSNFAKNDSCDQLSNEDPIKEKFFPKCDICLKTFKQTRYLKDHMLKVHQSKIKTCDKIAATKPLTIIKYCDLCNKAFKNIRNLREHIVVVHSDDRNFKCNFDLCSKSFKRKADLNFHMKSHAAIKFNCEICGKDFTTSSNLRRHVLIH